MRPIWRPAKLVIAGALLASGTVGYSWPAQSAPSAGQVADASSEPDATSAAQVAAQFGHRVEVSGLEQTNSTSYINPDGTRTDDLSATPVRIRQGSTWTPVDLTLRQQADGTITPVAAPVPVLIGAAGSTTPVTTTLGSGTVAFGWKSALPAPVLVANTATYADVAPGVDLLVQVTTTGAETSLVLKTAAAAAAGSYAISMSAHGLTATKDSVGAVAFTDATLGTVGRSPAPQAWDARLGGDPAGPGAGPVEPLQSVLKTSSGQTLQASPASGAVTTASGTLTDTLQVPSALANDSSTIYPIVLDPGVYCSGCSENSHGYVENDAPTEMNSTFDGGLVHVGSFNNGTSDTHGLFSFSRGDTDGQDILKATLNLKDDYSYSCTPEPVTVYKSAVFSGSSAWPEPYVTTTNAVQTSPFAYGYSASCAATSVGVDVTGIVADWANDSSNTYYYFQIRSPSTNSFYWKKFDPSASLTINFEPYPGTPGYRSVSPCWVQCGGSFIPTFDTQPALTARSYVLDDLNLDYEFKVYNADASWNYTTLAADINKNNNLSYTPPNHGTGNTVTIGYNDWGSQHLATSGPHNYLYTVRACDTDSESFATPVCSAWSNTYNGWMRFQVNATPPAVPGATPSTADQVPLGQPISVTFSPGDSTLVYGYAYSWAYTPPTYGRGTNNNPPISCGSDSNGIKFVCASNDDANSAKVTVAPLTTGTSTLYVWALSAAGGESSDYALAIPTGLSDIGIGHSWQTETPPDTSASCAAGPVQDTVDTTKQPLQTAQSLPIPSGVCWSPSTDAGLPNNDVNNPYWALNFNSPASKPVMRTAAPVLTDTRSTFTVAAWLDPTAAAVNDVTANGSGYTAMSESSSNHSSFYLQLGRYVGGDSSLAGTAQWRLCMQNQYGTVITTCVTSQTAGGVIANTWTYVLAVFDSANNELRLFLQGGPNPARTVPYYVVPNDTAATGGLTIGSSVGGGVTNGAWSGQILDPVAIARIPSPAQMSSLYFRKAPSAI